MPRLRTCKSPYDPFTRTDGTLEACPYMPNIRPPVRRITVDGHSMRSGVPTPPIIIRDEHGHVIDACWYLEVQGPSTLVFDPTKRATNGHPLLWIETRSPLLTGRCDPRQPGCSYGEVQP